MQGVQLKLRLKGLPRTFGDVYGNDAGHLEMQYSARAVWQ